MPAASGVTSLTRVAVTWLALITWTAPGVVAPATLAAGAVVWFDVTPTSPFTSCPGVSPDWINVPSPSVGRILIGDDGSHSGSSNAAVSLSDMENRTHHHSDFDGVNKLSATFAGGNLAFTTLSGNYILKSGTYSSYGIGQTQSVASNYPFVQLLACQLSASASSSYQVPGGSVILFNTPSPATCPTPNGLAPAPQFTGFALVGTSTAQPSPNFYTQVGSALAESAPSFSPHTHTLNPSNLATVSASLGSSSQDVADSTIATVGPFSVSGSVGASDPGLPLTRALVCAASPSAPSSANPLPSGALVLVAASSCTSVGLTGTVAPAAFGRLMVTSSNSFTLLGTFGSSTLLTSSLPTHDHGTTWLNAPQIGVPFNSSFWTPTASPNGGTAFDLYQSAPVPGPSYPSPTTFRQYPVSQPTASPILSTTASVGIPYVMLLLCKTSTTTSSPTSVSPTTTASPVSSTPSSASPTSSAPTTGSPTTASPTSSSPSSVSPTTQSPVSSAPTSSSPTSRQPSSSPTTLQPSWSPSTAPNSKKPSRSPTSSPTKAVPSKSPTNRPTKFPHTGPSSSPQSSSPTASPLNAPSSSPITSWPSRTPTMARPSKSPTSSPSSQRPTSSPHVALPTQSPSQSPHSSRPSRSPTASPGTLQPSKSPSFRPTNQPHKEPSRSPASLLPSASPSQSPHKAPTFSPIRAPSVSPTIRTCNTDASVCASPALCTACWQWINPSCCSTQSTCLACMPSASPTLTPSPIASTKSPSSSSPSSTSPVTSIPSASPRSALASSTASSSTVAAIAGGASAVVALCALMSYILYRRRSRSRTFIQTSPLMGRGIGGNLALTPTVGRMATTTSSASSPNPVFQPAKQYGSPTFITLPPPPGLDTDLTRDLSYRNSPMNSFPSDSTGRHEVSKRSRASGNRATWSSMEPSATLVDLVSLHQFNPENEDELRLERGQHVQLIVQIDADWVVVRTDQGEIGAVPLNFLTLAGIQGMSMPGASPGIDP